MSATQAISIYKYMTINRRQSCGRCGLVSSSDCFRAFGINYLSSTVFLNSFGESSSTLASAKFVISKKAAISKHDACIPPRILQRSTRMFFLRKSTSKKRKKFFRSPPVKTKCIDSSALVFKSFIAPILIYKFCL